MTDEEIFKSWRDAADPRKQVQILADLNGKKKQDIAKVLVNQCEKNSFTVPTYLKDASNSDIGAVIAAYAKKNFYCKQIAEALGISEFRVKSYCDKHGIQLAKADRFGNIIWAPDRDGELESDFKLDPVEIPQKSALPKPIVEPEPAPEPENAVESGGNADETTEPEPLLFTETKAEPSLIAEIAEVLASHAERLDKGEVTVTAYPDGTIIVNWQFAKGGESK